MVTSGGRVVKLGTNGNREKEQWRIGEEGGSKYQIPVKIDSINMMDSTFRYYSLFEFACSPGYWAFNYGIFWIPASEMTGKLLQCVVITKIRSGSVGDARKKSRELSTVNCFKTT